MPKLHIMSDLHTEFSARFSMSHSPKYHIRDIGADIIVLAGDIGTLIAQKGWPVQQDKQIPIVYVPGNHEFYQSDISGYVEALSAVSPPNVFVLNNAVKILEGIRFLGTTLWTDFAINGKGNVVQEQLYAAKHINDYRFIKYKRQKLRPKDTLIFHKEAVDWLCVKLDEKFDGPTVVVTHHAPSLLSIPIQYKDYKFNGAFVSRLEPLFKKYKFNLWIHGHTHSSFRYSLYGIPIICNPRGYVPDQVNPSFNPALCFYI